MAEIGIEGALGVSRVWNLPVKDGGRDLPMTEVVSRRSRRGSGSAGRLRGRGGRTAKQIHHLIIAFGHDVLIV